MMKRIASLVLLASIMFCGEAFAQEAQCVTGYGQTACGYNCISGYGEVKCSQTPVGNCIQGYGSVYCWDPSGWANRQAECISGYGDLACGYGCVSAYGEVKCSSNPNGVCQAANGEIVCF